MSLNAKRAKGGNVSNKPKQPVIDPGSYPARLVQVIDLGIQKQRPWKGETKPPVQMIHVTFELVDEFMLDEDGNELEDKPRWLSEEFPLYNLKSEKAKSTQRYMALDPNVDQDGDWSGLLGHPANAMITTYKIKSGPNEGQERNKIESLTAMRPRDAKKTPDLVNEPKVFSLEEPDLEVFNTLPEWLQEKIKGNLEYNGSALQALLEGGKAKPKPAPEEEEEEPEEAPEADVEGDEDDGDEKPW